MTGRYAAALLASLLAASPAAAQLATSTVGSVGSASLRNGYPAAGGAVALPTLPPSTISSTTAPVAAGTNPASAGGASAVSGGSAGPRGRAAAGSAASATSRGGGTNWVLCPPGAASGPAPFLAGTDLSCAPE